MKKISILGLYCVLAIFSLCTCSKDHMPYSNSPAEDAQQIENIPIEDALSSLDRCLSHLYGPQTRAVAKVYDRSRIGIVGRSDIFGPVTKSDCGTEIPDTLLYVVNFENDNGYAVLSANTILSESIFCITERGNMALDSNVLIVDLPPNIGGNATRIVEDDREMTEEEIEADTLYIAGLSPEEAGTTIQQLIISRIIVDIYNNDNSQVKPAEDVVNRPSTGPATNKYGPYLNTKWGQEEPFNKIFINNDDKPYPMGCVAIATGQIMVCNKYSSTMTFNGVECSWDDLESVWHYTTLNDYTNDNADYQATNFVYELGKKYNLNINYDLDGSGAKPKNVKRTLKNFGYRNAKLHCGFGENNQGKAISQLKNGYPVFLSRNRSNTKGHAWVLDGYYYDLYNSLFHVNWGWYGLADGYYACGLFDTSSRSDTDDEIDKNTGGDTPSENRNYFKYFRMVTYNL